MNKRLQDVKDYLQNNPNHKLDMGSWFTCLVGTSVLISDDAYFNHCADVVIECREIDVSEYGQEYLDLEPNAFYIQDQSEEIQALYLIERHSDYIDAIWERYGKE